LIKFINYKLHKMIKLENNYKSALVALSQFRAVFSVILGFILFNFSIIFFPLYVSAAELKLESGKKDLNIFQQFQVDLLINSEGDYINAIEGDILYPKEKLDLIEIREGSSIISFWIKEPQERSGGRAEFAGIIPGGYLNRRGLLFSMIFLPKEAGAGVIGMQNTRVLINDGKGTEALLSTSSWEFSISDLNPSPSRVPIIKDNNPPELFSPVITRDSSIFGGKWFLVFSTKDKGVGIDHYEIKEIMKLSGDEGNWNRAKSPYLLNDQDLKSYIHIKAIDKNSNERLAILHPQKPAGSNLQNTLWVIIFLGFIILNIVFFVLWKKHRLRRNNSKDY